MRTGGELRIENSNSSGRGVMQAVRTYRKHCKKQQSMKNVADVANVVQSSERMIKGVNYAKSSRMKKKREDGMEKRQVDQTWCRAGETGDKIKIKLGIGIAYIYKHKEKQNGRRNKKHKKRKKRKKS